MSKSEYRNTQARNKGKQENCMSKFKGVYFENGKWRARIKDEYGNPHHLGMFSEEIEAAKAVDIFLKICYGEECPWTNDKLLLLKG